MHHKKGQPASVGRVSNLTADMEKAKQFLPFLLRAGRTPAVVEYVVSGSRLRVYVPRETCLATLVLAGVQCPRPSTKSSEPGEPFGDAALAFTRRRCYQRDIEVSVDGVDKRGAFVSTVHAQNENVSLLLVEAGLASVLRLRSAEHLAYYRELCEREAAAKTQRRGIWENYTEPPPPTAAASEAEADDGAPEGRTDAAAAKAAAPSVPAAQDVIVSDVVDCTAFWAFPAGASVARPACRSRRSGC